MQEFCNESITFASLFLSLSCSISLSSFTFSIEKEEKELWHLRADAAVEFLKCCTSSSCYEMRESRNLGVGQGNENNKPNFALLSLYLSLSLSLSLSRFLSGSPSFDSLILFLQLLLSSLELLNSNTNRQSNQNAVKSERR